MILAVCVSAALGCRAGLGIKRMLEDLEIEMTENSAFGRICGALALFFLKLQTEKT